MKTTNKITKIMIMFFLIQITFAQFYPEAIDISKSSYTASSPSTSIDIYNNLFLRTDDQILVKSYYMTSTGLTQNLDYRTGGVCQPVDSKVIPKFNTLDFYCTYFPDLKYRGYLYEHYPS